MESYCNQNLAYDVTNISADEKGWSTMNIYIYIYIGGESFHIDMATQGFMLHGCNNHQATCIVDLQSQI